MALIDMKNKVKKVGVPSPLIDDLARLTACMTETEQM